MARTGSGGVEKYCRYAGCDFSSGQLCFRNKVMVFHLSQPPRDRAADDA